MFENHQPIHIQELQWLARYYELRGRTAEAQEIRDKLAASRQKDKPGTVTQMFNHDEQQSA